MYSGVRRRHSALHGSSPVRNRGADGRFGADARPMMKHIEEDIISKQITISPGSGLLWETRPPIRRPVPIRSERRIQLPEKEETSRQAGPPPACRAIRAKLTTGDFWNRNRLSAALSPLVSGRRQQSSGKPSYDPLMPRSVATGNLPVERRYLRISRDRPTFPTSSRSPAPLSAVHSYSRRLFSGYCDSCARSTPLTGMETRRRDDRSVTPRPPSRPSRRGGGACSSTSRS